MKEVRNEKLNKVFECYIIGSRDIPLADQPSRPQGHVFSKKYKDTRPEKPAYHKVSHNSI
jgi:hypothetical protein